MDGWHARRKPSQSERRHRELDVVQTAVLLAMRKTEDVRMGDGEKLILRKTLQTALAEIDSLRREIDGQKRA